MRPVLHLADRHLHGEQPEHEQRAAQVAAVPRERASRAARRTRRRRPPSRARASRPPDRTTTDRRTTVLPGCGPAAVASVPLTTSTPSETQTAIAPSCDPRRHAVERARPQLDRQRHRERQHDDREQEVREHEPRVEVVVDRDRPERRLRERPDEDQQRDDARAAGDAHASHAPTAVASVTRIVKNATTRFPNSM